MIAEDYITAIKVKLLTSAIIESFTIVREKAIIDQGYFRVRINLKNGDFLELVEFFTVRDRDCITKSYRYQWMDATQKQLRRRWDNVEHFPDLANFPHHVHIAAEENVQPSQPRNIIEIIDYLSLLLVLLGLLVNPLNRPRIEIRG